MNDTTKPRTLFAIGDDLLALETLLDEVGGDVTDADAEAAVDAWFAQLGAERDRKLDAYCAVIREIEARASARTAEAERVAALAKRDTADAARLRGRLHAFLSAHDIARLDIARASLRVQRNGGVAPLVFDDVTAIPQSFIREEAVVSVPSNTPASELLFDLVNALDLQGFDVNVTEAVDKKAIRAALDAGKAVPGAYLGERSTRLVIK